MRKQQVHNAHAFLSNKCNQSCSKLPHQNGVTLNKERFCGYKHLPLISSNRYFSVNICDKHKSKRCFWLSFDMLGEINFQPKLRLKASNFFVWKLLSRQKKKVEGVVRHLENLGGQGQKPSVTDLSRKDLATWLL